MEPLLQRGVVLEEVWVEAALNEGGEVGHEDQVSQRDGLGSGKETTIKYKMEICFIIELNFIPVYVTDLGKLNLSMVIWF